MLSTLTSANSGWWPLLLECWLSALVRGYKVPSMLKEVSYESTPKLEALSLSESWNGGMLSAEDLADLVRSECCSTLTNDVNITSD